MLAETASISGGVAICQVASGNANSWPTLLRHKHGFLGHPVYVVITFVNKVV